RVARRRRVPLVNSVHTNTPEYARLFTEEVVARVFKGGAAARLLLDGLDFARKVERRMLRRLAAHQDHCAFALLSRPEPLDAAAGRRGARAALLRRGIDTVFFDPWRRDRAWLQSAFGIARNRLVLLYAGRINRGKNVRLVAETAAALLDRGLPVHL